MVIRDSNMLLIQHQNCLLLSNKRASSAKLIKINAGLGLGTNSTKFHVETTSLIWLTLIDSTSFHMEISVIVFLLNAIDSISLTLSHEVRGSVWGLAVCN